MIEIRNLEVTIEMIRDGESNDKIKKYTGFTDNEISKLRAKNRAVLVS